MFTTRPELIGTYGMVASSHWLSSAVGMAVLEDGGNAFDAAVATGFLLQVVQPHLVGPAGEVPAVFAVAGGPPRVLCGQGVAPAAATIAHYRDELGLELVPGTGLLATVVPGAWDAWLLLLRDHGTKTLREVLAPAIGYARDGFPVVAGAATALQQIRSQFLDHWTASAEQWLPGGDVPGVGTRLRLPALADTWERLLSEAEAAGSDRDAQIEAGRRAWSGGFVAEAIDRFCRVPARDDSGEDHVGVLTGADMASWSASYEDALTVDLAGGWTLAKCGAWSQGPALAQQLLLLEGFADRLAYVNGVPTTETVHLAVECAKLAFADREAWYGDSLVDSTVMADLLSPAYADERRALVSDRASLELRPGSPGGRTPRLPAFVTEERGVGDKGGRAGGIGEPTVATSGTTKGDTVHIDVVDRWGNMVSVTPSGGWFQSSPTIPELGFCLGTRAQMFWLEPDLPNSLGPGKRPRTTLTPSLALRDGRAALSFGTPGGDQQDQWQLCFWLAHIVGGLDLQAAVDAPMWHSNAFPSSFHPRSWAPGEVAVETRLDPGTAQELTDRGHRVMPVGPWSLGGLSAVARDDATGFLRAGASPRWAQAYAAGR